MKTTHPIKTLPEIVSGRVFFAGWSGIVMPKPNCNKCRFLKRYISEDGESWMNICDGEEPESGENDGLYLVTVVDTEEFDASECIIFKEA